LEFDPPIVELDKSHWRIPVKTLLSTGRVLQKLKDFKHYQLTAFQRHDSIQMAKETISIS
jgi:hypothetical protein